MVNVLNLKSEKYSELYINKLNTHTRARILLVNINGWEAYLPIVKVFFICGLLEYAVFYCVNFVIEFSA